MKEILEAVKIIAYVNSVSNCANVFPIDKTVACVNSNWPYFVLPWFSVPFEGYSHFQTYNHPTYNEPQLLPKLPLENINLPCDVFNSCLLNVFIFCWRNSVVIILQQKDTYLKPPQPAGGYIFCLILFFQLTTNSTRCSEHSVFVSHSVPVWIL